MDEYLYTDDRYYKRVRFNLAHEIGHYILHRSTIDNQKFKDLDDWMSFRLNLNNETLGWFETQASEFAGRLLVPVDHLAEEFKAKRNSILRKYSAWDSKPLGDDDLFSMVSPLICNKFDVSFEVIERRLRKENILAILSGQIGEFTC